MLACTAWLLLSPGPPHSNHMPLKAGITGQRGSAAPRSHHHHSFQVYGVGLTRAGLPFEPIMYPAQFVRRTPGTVECRKQKRAKPGTPAADSCSGEDVALYQARKAAPIALQGPRHFLICGAGRRLPPTVLSLAFLHCAVCSHFQHLSSQARTPAATCRLGSKYDGQTPAGGSRPAAGGTAGTARQRR
jgi:hypothetical protein